jgi:hypothetical protein
MRTQVLALALCCAAPSALHAQSEPESERPPLLEEPQLGARGQWMLRGSAGGSWKTSRQVTDSQDNFNPVPDVTHLWLSFSPGALVFVAKNFAVGGQLSFGLEHYGYDQFTDAESSNLVIGGSVLTAFHASLGKNSFLLPELGLGAFYADRQATESTATSRSGVGLVRNSGWHSTTLLQATFSLPFAFVLGPRFYAGVGPEVQFCWGPSGGVSPRDDEWGLALGISTVFGTWL